MFQIRLLKMCIRDSLVHFLFISKEIGHVKNSIIRYIVGYKGTVGSCQFQGTHLYGFHLLPSISKLGVRINGDIPFPRGLLIQELVKMLECLVVGIGSSCLLYTSCPHQPVRIFPWAP